MTRIASILLASLIALSARTARAGDDPRDNWNGVGAGAVVVTAVELAPLVMLSADLVARPSSKTYGGFELAVGGVATAMNAYLAIDSWTAGGSGGCDGCKSFTPVFAGLALIDAAAAAHGTYLLLHEERERPLSFAVGSTRGRIAPTVVNDGKSSAPGFGLSGTF